MNRPGDVKDGRPEPVDVPGRRSVDKRLEKVEKNIYRITWALWGDPDDSQDGGLVNDVRGLRKLIIGATAAICTPLTLNVILSVLQAHS